MPDTCLSKLVKGDGGDDDNDGDDDTDNNDSSSHVSSALSVPSTILSITMYHLIEIPPLPRYVTLFMPLICSQENGGTKWLSNIPKITQQVEPFSIKFLNLNS